MIFGKMNIVFILDDKEIFMIEYYVFNTETGDELFSSSKVSECRLFAKSYSKENCVPVLFRLFFVKNIM